MKLFPIKIHFWQGLPALIASLLFASFLGIILRVNPTETRKYYQQSGDLAFSQKNYEMARIAYQRLISMENGVNLETVLQLALTLEGMGRKDEALALMGTLAPLNQARYAPAHLIIAKSLIKDGNLSPENTKIFEQHLMHALVLDPKSTTANELLGRFYYLGKNWSLAKKYLKSAVAGDPSIMFMLINTFKQLHDEPGAQNWAAQAADYYQNQVEIKKSENPNDRLMWVNALIAMERYEEALDGLEEGYRLSQTPIYLQVISEVCALWVRNLEKKEAKNLVQQVRLIQRGLQADPKNNSILAFIFEMGRSLEGREGIATRNELLKIQAEGKSSALLHLIIGNDAMKHGEIDSARSHFEIAYELDPLLLAVANNLALVMIQGDSPDPTRALNLIQPALDKMPNNPNLRETRGQIFTKLKRWKDAIADLEFALPQIESKKATHEALSKAYSEMGMQDLADEHQRLSTEK